ncbi:MAG: AarF/ABC1/UbiB kinase family protein [Anaerolineales bacterium]|nr:AarF/ABC1/UbiB kinase family protein [Anaerolineales bacterium]
MRYRRILFFFSRVLLGLLFWDILLPRFGLGALSQRNRSRRLRHIAIGFRKLAVHMGGVLIKVGQFLSTRVDVLPPEITAELADLQDEVPPVDFEKIQALAEAELNASLPQVFHQFARQPLAAASLGQVHQAILHDDSARQAGFRHVVVKVQRPQIEAIVDTDLAALRKVATWLQLYRPIARRADIPALLREFSRTLYEEVDYLAEGANADTFRENFSDRPGICVPRVVWTHTTRRVLVLEDVYAIKITDYEAITAAGIDRAEVAQRLFETYLQQIFIDGFFHADPHPGNLFVTPYQRAENQGQPDWQLVFVDFGMVGHVPEKIRAGLREMAIGVGSQDAARVVKSYQMLGVLLPSADLQMIERAEAQVFERFWGKSMGELQQIDMEEMVAFASEYRELIYDLPFQIPNDILYLARCVAILSGMCTGLNPNFNVWQGLAPFAERLIAEEAGKTWEVYLESLGNYARLLVQLPHRLDTSLKRLERGEIAVRTPGVDERLRRLERTNRRILNAIIFAALLLGGVQLYTAGNTVFSTFLLVGAGLVLLRTIWITSD